MGDRSDYMAAARLQELTKQIDPRVSLEPEAEQLLKEVADDFVESLTAFACELATHRNGTMLEIKDIQLALDKNWGMRLVGVGDNNGEVRIIKKPPVMTEAHKARLADVKRSKQLAHK